MSLQRTDLVLLCGCRVFHMYMNHIFFIQSIIDWHLGWFRVFAIVKSTAMNIHMHVSLLQNYFYSFGYKPSNGITGPNDIYVSRSLRTDHNVFHNDWTSLYSHQQCKSIYFSLQPHKHLFLFFFDRVLLCRPGWSAVSWSQLTAISTSWVQAILITQHC